MITEEELILAWPSKPQNGLETTLQEFKKYACLRNVPQEILSKVRSALFPDQVLTVWARKGYGFGQEAIYSIENIGAARATHELHKKDYGRYNPKLMRFYTAEDINTLTKGIQ